MLSTAVSSPTAGSPQITPLKNISTPPPVVRRLFSAPRRSARQEQAKGDDYAAFGKRVPVRAELLKRLAEAHSARLCCQIPRLTASVA